MKTLLNDMLDKNIIKKSCSPYDSPIVLVKKKTGALRLYYIDYRQLNTVTVKVSSLCRESKRLFKPWEEPNTSLHSIFLMAIFR